VSCGCAPDPCGVSKTSWFTPLRWEREASYVDLIRITIARPDRATPTATTRTGTTCAAAIEKPLAARAAVAMVAALGRKP
jgi:hypothetical protein